jgi:hypothetical protein
VKDFFFLLTGAVKLITGSLLIIECDLIVVGGSLFLFTRLTTGFWSALKRHAA